MSADGGDGAGVEVLAYGVDTDADANIAMSDVDDDHDHGHDYDHDDDDLGDDNGDGARFEAGLPARVHLRFEFGEGRPQLGTPLPLVGY